MRVQHNIAAMNSYRNYNNNTRTINKNLEKLSSGYKINRAGDDAAGLAISEKMRAQITGLAGAQKNAKDGISLVQTAEGALTEVHSMLNRMYELAEESANGTFEGVDRDQLQKEVHQLRTEINRIADSSNFNGIKLLDGSMNGGAGGSKVVSVSASTSVDGAIEDATDQAQSVQTATYSAIANKFQDGDSFTVSLQLDNGSVYNETYTISKKSDGSASLKLSDGNTSGVTLTAYTGVTAADWGKLVQEIADKNESLQNVLTVASNGTTFTGVSNSFSTPAVKSINLSGGKVNVSAQVVDTTEGKGYYQKLNATSMSTFKGDGSVRAEDSVFTINGVEFAFVENAAAAKALGSNVNTVVAAGNSPTAAEVTTMVDLINQKTGLSIKDNADGKIDLYSRGSNGSTGGLVLQIGDTADSYNKLSVAIEDMHASAMGIGGIDISGQAGAQTAMNAIKNAITYVSETRGTLGATQNRLEHTINNLSVMQENIQDAESTIRDTDVADEMMKYTKNSILVQSAQAMLAQANQQPQGVLQLLQ